MFSIDHLVLPVLSLDGARQRLSALGFTIATEAAHPFGTANACVFLADGIYLEPLAVANRAAYDAASEAGNVFTRNDRMFREAIGDEGLSAIALQRADAAADHARFAGAGLSGGDMLEFSRPAKLPDGTEKTARFRLAFVASDPGHGPALFTCERVDPLPADRRALEQHANGAVALSEVVVRLSPLDPAAGRMETILETTATGLEAGATRLAGSNASLRLLAMDAVDEGFASSAAIVFRVGDLAVTRAVLAANDVPFVQKGGRVVVAAAPGQGAVFAFEE